MEQFRYVIKEKTGIHARPAGALAKLAKDLDCRVTIAKGERSADAARLMAVMGLGIRQGDEVTVSVDNGARLAEVKTFFEKHF